MYDDRRKSLRRQLASVKAERAKIRVGIRTLRANDLTLRMKEHWLEGQFDLLDDLEKGVGSPDAYIRPPLTEGVNQHDWVCKLVNANPVGLNQEQIIDYVGPRIETKAKSVAKAIRDALSHLVNEGRILRSNGVYLPSENPVGRPAGQPRAGSLGLTPGGTGGRRIEPGPRDHRQI